MLLRARSLLSWVICTVHIFTLGIQTGFCYVDGSVVFHLHHMVIIQQQLAHCYPLVSLQEPHIHGVYAWGLASPQYLCSMSSTVQLTCPLNVEISCNDISFNFNYIMVVMYGTSAERCVQGNWLKTFLVKHFSPNMSTWESTRIPPHINGVLHLWD